MQLKYTSKQIRAPRYFFYNYSGQILRIVRVNSCSLPGFEKDKGLLSPVYDYNSDYVQQKSLSRTKKNIRELALCNSFEYFVTLTINSEKCDRYSLDECQKRLKKTLKNIRDYYDKSFKYLLITEKHKDGAFHFHGLMKNVPKLYINEHGYFSCELFDKTMGYNSFSPIKDYNKCCNYIMKYITKDCVKNSHNQIYISSNGLKKADRSEILPFEFEPTYRSKYCDIFQKNFSDLTKDEILNFSYNVVDINFGL